MEHDKRVMDEKSNVTLSCDPLRILWISFLSVKYSQFLLNYEMMSTVTILFVHISTRWTHHQHEHIDGMSNKCTFNCRIWFGIFKTNTYSIGLMFDSHRKRLLNQHWIFHLKLCVTNKYIMQSEAFPKGNISSHTLCNRWNHLRNFGCMKNQSTKPALHLVVKGDNDDDNDDVNDVKEQA